MPDHPEIYQSQAKHYEALVSQEDHQHNIFPALQQIVQLDSLIVVEFGAGTGRLTCQLAPVVKFIHAFDISQHMLDVAIAKLEKSSLRNWRMEVGDHRKIPIEDGLADLVISGWSVCYIVDEHPVTWQLELEKVLSEMRRVLHPGGKIILLETLGTGFKEPEPPAHLIAYFQFLETQGFQSNWIRTDYLFENMETAKTLASFFFGEEITEKIEKTDLGFILPECTGIWLYSNI